MRNVYASIVLGILITPIFYLLAAFYSGGGHSLTGMFVFFPYGVLCGRLFTAVFQWLEPILIVLQFPVYGALLSWALRRNTFKIALTTIAALHLITTAAGLLIEHFYHAG